MRNLPDMKYLIISFLIYGLLGCSQSNTKNESVEYVDIKEFYFPLKNDLSPTTYTYEVTTETQDGIQVDREYLKIQSLGDNYYAFSSYGSSMNLLDSTIILVDKNGANIDRYFIVSEDNILVSASVSPKLIFPWNCNPQEKRKNEIRYVTKMYGALTELSIDITNSIEGFENLNSSITKDTECVKISIQTDMTFKNTETREKVKYTTIGEMYDLKGVGLYKSVESDNFGLTITKRLIEIKM